jgi:hypothetical protein
MHPTTPDVRRRGPLRLVLAVLAVALLSAGLAGPAEAERYIHRDPARDVRKVNIFSTTDEGLVRAPHRKQGDYVKVKIWHQVKHVRVVGKFRQLERKGAGLTQIVSIRTPGGHERAFAVYSGPGLWKGMTEGDENCVVGHRVNFERDRFSMRISRACLDRPRWVRVGVGVITGNDSAVFADDSQLRRVRNQLTYSPRLSHA